MAIVPTTTLSTQDTTIAQPDVTEQMTGFDVVPFLRMSKEEMDDLLFEQRLQQEEAREEGKSIPGTRTTRFAKYVADTVATQVPGKMTYESLKDGTAPIFEELTPYQGLDPKERALTDDQILQMLLRNPDGKRIERGSFIEGVKEEIAPQAGGFAGAVAGATAGAALVAGVPPVTPPTIAAKFMVPAVGAIIGGLFGQEAVRTGQRKLFGEESLILPETTGPYEAGKTTAGVLGFFATPWALGRKLLTGEARDINFGAQQFIENARRLKMAAQPAQDAAKLGKNYIGTDLSRLAQQAENIPRSTRTIAAIEKGLQGLGRQAREQPKTLAAIEAAAGAGSAYLGQMAEEAAPGEVLPRIAGETVGAIVGSAAGQPAISIVGALPTLLTDPLAPFRSLRDIWRQGGLEGVFEKVTGKDARREKAIRYLLELFEQQGEDVDEVIKRLNEVNTFLVDPETGKTIDLTAPAKSGSGTLLGVEAALSNIAPTLAKQRIAGSEKAVQAMRAQVRMLAAVAGSDPDLLQALADQMKVVFDANFASDIAYATEILTRALGREGLGTTGMEEVDALALNQQELGQKLYDVMDAQLKRARAQERSLWRNVPIIEQAIDPENIPSFQFEFNEFDGPVDTNFIAGWDRLLPSTPEARAVFFKNANVLKEIQNFVDRKQREFLEEGGEGFNLFRSGPILSSQELTDMRSIALSAVRQLRAESKFDEARIAGKYADILLEQLNQLPDESFTVPYREARAFSRALNDTFTRAFAGDILQQNAKGGTRDAPELLADQLLRGSASATFLRINQIQEAGRFMGPSFVGPVQLVPGLSQIQEAILREARTRALTPNTPEGAVNRNNLGRFMKENENLLNLFPALRADLEDINTASVLLDQTEEYAKRKQRELNQDISFMNLTSSEKRSPARAVAQIFSPSTEFPYKALDRFVEVIDSASDVTKRIDPATKKEITVRGPEGEAAAKALQGAIVEWAATSGGLGSNQQFKPSVMYKALFTPDAVKFQKRSSSISPIEYMQEKGLITQAEVTNLSKLLKEMIKYEIGVQQGNIEQLAAEAGPMLDFFLRVSGATLGARASQAMGNRQSIVAAGAGSRAIRNVAYNLPLAMQMDVMKEFMENPEMLAAWLTKFKGTDAAEREGILNSAMTYLQRMGINIFRRPAPGMGREATEEGLIIEPATEAVIGKPVEREERFGEDRTPRTAPAPQLPIAQAEPRPTGPLSIQNNNPGNLRLAGQPGATEGQGGFAAFSSPGQGLRALTQQVVLDTQTRGMNLEDFLNKYAPPSENKTNQYISFVERQTGLDAKGKVPESKIPQLVRAIVRMEGGQAAVDYFYGQQRAEAAPAPQPPVAQAAPPMPPAPAPVSPQSLQRAAQILGPQDEIGMLASEMLVRQRPA